MSIKKFSRTNPYLSRIKERKLLSGTTSSKKTYHVSLELAEPFSFKVGDSIAIIPQNDREEVERILQVIQSDDPTLREHLLHKANISRVNSSFLKLLTQEEPLFLPENKVQLTELLHSHSLLEILHRYPTKDSSVFTKLMPLLPRFYSIANSPHVFSDEIHLLVAYVSYVANGQLRTGVGSHFLCHQALIHETEVPIYLQPSNHFTLPEDPLASIILVGPGTGIAPFRAFLQERIATQALGRNWLFFGDRNRETDFYYEEFFMELVQLGRLRLDLAFSRDAPSKTYVQHRMYEERKSLWNWLNDGAYFYVCGDAEKMAKDVDAMLRKIVREEGNMSEEDANQYIKKLKLEKRYLTDVY